MALVHTCAFCGATLSTPPDPMTGVIDCAACGKMVQLTAEAITAEKPVALSAVGCQRCQKPLARADVDAKYGVCKCVACGAINDLGGRYRAAKLKAAKELKTELQVRQVSQPRLFEVLEVPGALEISWKDSNPVGIGLLILIAMTMANLAGMMTLLLTPPLWIASTALSVGVLLYSGVVATGRLTIVASKDALTIERRRLWWPRRIVKRAQLQQLFVRETTHHDNQGNLIRRWWLAAVVDGRRKPLVLTPDFTDASYPRFLEQTLERYLGIKDRPVPATY